MIDFTDATVVVTDPLTMGMTRAANPGDIVSRETVEAHPEWEGLYVEHGTDEAIAALGYNPYAGDGAKVSDNQPDGTFDPASASVAQVLEHVELVPESTAGILEAELARESPRSTLVDKLKALLA